MRFSAKTVSDVNQLRKWMEKLAKMGAKDGEMKELRKIARSFEKQGMKV